MSRSARSRETADRPHGRENLSAFLEQNGLTRQAAADALGVSKTAVINWLNGKWRPEHPMRDAIEVWTNGVVRADAWKTAEERRNVVRPFEAPVKPAAA